MLTFLLTLLLLAPVALFLRGIASTGARFRLPSGDLGEADTGAKDDDSEKDDDADADAESDDDQGDDADEGDDDKLKPEDDKNSVEYWKKRSRQNEREARRLKREANTGGKKDEAKDKEPTADEIREQARTEAKAEVLRERVTDKIEAKAREFANPSQAVAIVLHQNDINDFLDDDKIDVEAIEEALADLLDNSPNLGAVQDGKRFKGGGDGGARKEQKSKPRSLEEAIAARISS